MQNWIKQIEKDKEDRRRSVNFALNLNGERDELLKSAASDYGTLNNLSISKKGSEIKEKLQTEKMKVGEVVISVSEKLNNIVKSVGEPNGKTYSYEEIYSEDVDSENASLMRDFNNLTSKMDTLKSEVSTLNGWIENIQDNKPYELPARVLSELGF